MKTHFKIAILVVNDFEEEEYLCAKTWFEQKGCATALISPDGPSVHSWRMIKRGNLWPCEISPDSLSPDQFDGLFLPGSFRNPDALGDNPAIATFIRRMFEQKKCISAVCQGSWTLVQLGLVKGYALTAWPSYQKHIEKAGGFLLAESVASDRHLHTASLPFYIPQLVNTMVAYLDKTEMPYFEKTRKIG